MSRKNQKDKSKVIEQSPENILPKSYPVIVKFAGEVTKIQTCTWTVEEGTTYGKT